MATHANITRRASVGALVTALAAGLPSELDTAISAFQAAGTALVDAVENLNALDDSGMRAGVAEYDAARLAVTKAFCVESDAADALISLRCANVEEAHRKAQCLLSSSLVADNEPPPHWFGLLLQSLTRPSGAG